MTIRLNHFSPWLTRLRSILPVLALLVGILLRLKHYFENRSFWLDESWVGLEVVNRSVNEIARQDVLLPSLPHPSTLFLLTEKVATLVFGNSEMTLRLFPLICGIASFLLFYRIAKRHLPPAAFLVALWLFSIAEPLVYYSAELKQYSSDLLCACFFWLLAPSLLRKNLSWKNATFIAANCAALLWLSYASIFVLTPILGLAWLHAFLRRKYQKLKPLLLISLASIVNFLVIYQLSLQQMANNNKVKAMWHEGLWAQGSSLPAFLIWISGVILESMTSPAGLGWPYLALALISAGIVVSTKRDAWITASFCLPLVLTLSAAALGIYPFRGRLILFLLPAYYLFLAQGLDWVAIRSKHLRSAVFMTLLILVFAQPLMVATHYLSSSRSKTDNRSAMEFLRDHYQPGDFIYLSNNAHLPFCYYSGVLELGKQFPQKVYGIYNGQPQVAMKAGKFAAETETMFGKKFAFYNYDYQVYDANGYFQQALGSAQEPAKPAGELSSRPFPEQGRVWLFLSNANGNDDEETNSIIRATFERVSTRLLSFERPGAGIYLYDFK